MTTYTACLVDVYETALSVDLPEWGALLAATAQGRPAGVRRGRLAESGPGGGRPVDGPSERSRTTLVDLGVADRRRRRGPDAGRGPASYVRERAVLHEDTVPFLESLRAKGVRTAFVSNCADNTRPLLEWLGLSSLVDELVLSCEVGAAKPDPVIFEVALARLGVAAEDTLFVDDQQAFCDAAAALGIRAVRIDRAAGAGEVSTLSDLVEYF